jgi:hypothetical protein
VKPHRQNRNRSYYRHHRKRVIRRKAKIVEQIGWYERRLGCFAKGKIHCSCWMCTEKTRISGYPKSEKVRLESLNHQLSNYLNNREA